MALANTPTGRLFNAFKEADAAFSTDGNEFFGVGGIYTSATPSYDNNDAVPFHFSSDGKLLVDTELTLDGNVIIDNISVYATNIADSSTSGPALIDANGHVQVDVLTMAGGLTGYAEDSVHNSGDTGIMSLAVRSDTAAATAADGDYVPLLTDSNGRLHIVQSGVTTAAPLNVQLGDGTTQVDVIAGTTALKTDLSSVAGTATNVNGGNRDAGTQTITLADDDPAVVSLAILDDWDSSHGSAVGTDGVTITAEAKDFDGSALPNSVTEGQATRIAATLYGIPFSMLVNEDGSGTPIVTESAAISAANGGTVGLMQVLQARSSQKTAVTEDDAVRPVTNLYGEQVIAGYNWSSSSIRTSEVNPLSTHYLEESLVDTTDVTATTHYYPSSTGMAMAGYKDLSISGKLIDADGTLTLTVEATNDEDTASGDWIQVYGYDDKNNATSNSWSVTNGTLTFANSFNECNFKYVRIAVVASGATNTVIIKSRKKAL